MVNHELWEAESLQQILKLEVKLTLNPWMKHSSSVFFILGLNCVPAW